MASDSQSLCLCRAFQGLSFSERQYSTGWLNGGLYNLITRAQILVLELTSRVTVDKLLTLSVPRASLLYNRVMMILPPGLL